METDKEGQSVKETFCVLLVGNYSADRQFSMQRFTSLLDDSLQQIGLTTHIFHPPLVFGKFGAAPSGLGKWIGYIDKYLLAPIALRRAVAKLKDLRVIVHICDHSNAIYTRALRNIPHLVTCHDLLAVRSALGEIPQNKPKWTGRQQQSMILKGLQRSQMIASVSEATRLDVSRLIGSEPHRMHYVPNALDSSFIEEALQPQELGTKAPGELPENSRYIMHIGGEKWYKNRKAVLIVFAKLRKENPDLCLAIIGPSFSERNLNECDCGDYESDIHYFSNITDETLRQLYKHAEFLLFPSIIEGFGWPILEAQACGCPVVTLAIEPMRSLNALQHLAVANDTMQGGYTDLLAETCQQQLEASSQLRAEQSKALRSFASRFTNKKSAEAYLELYQTLLAKER